MNPSVRILNSLCMAFVNATQRKSFEEKGKAKTALDIALEKQASGSPLSLEEKELLDVFEISNQPRK